MSRKIVYFATAFLALCIAFLASVQISTEELTYPMENGYSASVNASSLTGGKNNIIEEIGKLSDTQSQPIMLVKTGQEDSMNGVDLYVFGSSKASQVLASQSIPWFKTTRHGVIYDAVDLKSLSLSGHYVFSSANDCATFGRRSKSLGIYASPCTEREKIRWILQPSDNNGEEITLISLILLFTVSVWFWIGSRQSSQSLRLSNGVSLLSIVGQDLLALVSVVTIPLVVVWIGVSTYSLIVRGAEASHGLLQIMTGSYGLLLLLTGILGLAFIAILHPRTHQVAQRTDNSALIVVGDAVMKSVCLGLVFLALPISLVTTVQSQS